ncbi:DUF4097 family beta strand repeat-containing protein [Dellaglioa sp. BT-FLS60]
MKRSIKIGLILLIFGLILVAFGSVNDGIKPIYWQHGFHSAKKLTKTYYPKQIKSLTLSSDLPVEVRNGETSRIKVNATREQPKVTIHQGHVTISSRHAGSKYTMGISPDRSNKIIITVPENRTLDQVQAMSQQGDLQLTHLKIKKVQIKSRGDVYLDHLKTSKLIEINAIGDSQLTNVTAPQVTLVSSEGDLTLRENHFKSGSVITSDGDISLVNNQLEDHFFVKTNEGDIDVRANKNSGVHATSRDGDLSIFGRNIDDSNYTYQATAKSTYRLMTSDGDIAVTDY